MGNETTSSCFLVGENNLVGEQKRNIRNKKINLLEVNTSAIKIKQAGILIRESVN